MMFSAKLCRWRYFFFIFYLFILLLRIDVSAHLVNITYLHSAVAKGAVCLDGSPPAYHFSPGFESGVNNWLISLQGGGWCNNVTSCLVTKKTLFGSSKYMSKQLNFTGMLSKKSSLNPDFYNWNKVRVCYCDGSSFTGDIQIVDPATKLNYRGARIWHFVMEDLLSKGMKNADKAFLTGVSAGGLTSILHCDKFRALLPSKTYVKCLSDGGYIVNMKDISGKMSYQNYLNDVVTLHGSGDYLPSSCTSKFPPGLCFFPQNVIQYIETPLFILNTAYDSYQINKILLPDSADPNDNWHHCRINLKYCSSWQLEIIQGFRNEFIKALNKPEINCKSRGLFINSCFNHVQTDSQETWLSSHSPMLHNTTIAKAVGDWYYGRNKFQEIDCPYPCDTTCINEDWDPKY